MTRSKDSFAQTFKTYIAKLLSKFSEMHIPSKRIWWESYREMLHPLESFQWLTCLSVAWPDHLFSVSNQTAVAQFLATSFYCLPPSLFSHLSLFLHLSICLSEVTYSLMVSHIFFIFWYALFEQTQCTDISFTLILTLPSLERSLTISLKNNI